MGNNQKVFKLSLLSKGCNLLSDSKVKYVIPLYQRAFEWEKTQLEQLITDLSDYSADQYYLGSLVVSKKIDNQLTTEYEIIDGQQRTTAVAILLYVLKNHFIKNWTYGEINPPDYQCRERSKRTFDKIKSGPIKIVSSELYWGDIKDDDRDEGIIRAYNIFYKQIKTIEDKDDFVERLTKVKLFRIQVPDNTDLNRYYEIMNTRGVQLEQHDVVKAMLMKGIEGDNDRETFSVVWKACSDMTGYVQMHFSPEYRKQIFGTNWSKDPDLSNVNFSAIKNSTSELKHSILSVLESTKPRVQNTEYVDEDGKVRRFESIIEFPFFLLHVLKVFISSKTGQKVSDLEMIDSLLDDKKLYKSFYEVLKRKNLTELFPESEHPESEFALEFINCLLKERFLFDKYIIKREYSAEKTDGIWTIKTLHKSDKRKNSYSYYFSNTEFDKNNKDLLDKNVLIQSCLRVSYTSPKIMHWITELLNILNDEKFKICQLHTVAENLAKKAVNSDFFEECANHNHQHKYNLGLDTPHIVFNYLDYLLYWEWNWKKETFKQDDFKFEYRDSVEHWYPQHPSEGTIEKWSHDDGLDDLGNLCIVSSSVNSRFSNSHPVAKLEDNPNLVKSGSLKLRLMAGIIKNEEGDWIGDQLYKKHENQMIDLLKNATGYDDLDSVEPQEHSLDKKVKKDESQKNNYIDAKVNLTKLRLSEIIISWAEQKNNKRKIILNTDNCTGKFTRFTTERMSEILPDAKKSASGWNTKNHYFYEIVNAIEKKKNSIHMKLAFSSSNISKKLLNRCNKILELHPPRRKDDDWVWRCPFITKHIFIDEKMSDRDIIAILDDLFKKLMAFEKKVVNEMKDYR